MPSMTGKTVLVTGATSGIGEATARALAAKGARVLVHGRDAHRGQVIVEAIKTMTDNREVHFVEADLASLASVRALAAEVKRRTPALHVLLNNAGTAALKRSVTADGFELMWAVNFLAPFLLTHLLLDTMKASAPARIVNVSSVLHKGKPIDFDNLNLERNFAFMAGYHQSKLALMLFTHALAKRLAGTGVTANSLHPGGVNTGMMAQSMPPSLAWLRPLISPLLLTPDDGAKTSVYLASSPEVEGVSGKYFDKCKPAKASPLADDDAAAEKLWAIGAKMTALA